MGRHSLPGHIFPEPPAGHRQRSNWPLANAYSHFAARLLLPSRQDRTSVSALFAQLGTQASMLQTCLRLIDKPDASATYDSPLSNSPPTEGGQRTPGFRQLCQKSTLELVNLLERHAKWLIYVHVDQSAGSAKHFRQLRSNLRAGTEETTTKTGLQGITNPNPPDAEVACFRALWAQLLRLWAIDDASSACFCTPGGFNYDWLDPDKILKMAAEGGGAVVRGQKEPRASSAAMLQQFATNVGLPATFFHSVKPETTLTRAIAFLLKDAADKSDVSAMHGSHLCHHRFCLIHVVWESSLINMDRKNCYIYALESRRYGQGLPVHCARHPKKPCLLQIAQLTLDECISIQVNRLRASRGLAPQAFTTPSDHPFDSFVTTWPLPPSMTRD
ncbi:hypothetical protein PG984_011203 [Apiospora sp. TS-2023a]